MTQKLSQKVLNIIKKKHLAPKPKIYFYLSSLLFGFAIASSFILAMFCLNLFFFHLPRNSLGLPLPFFVFRPLPLIYLLVTIILMTASIHLLAKNQYKHSLFAVFLGAMLFVFAGHFLISCLRPHQRFPSPLRRFYQRQLITPFPKRNKLSL